MFVKKFKFQDDKDKAKFIGMRIMLARKMVKMLQYKLAEMLRISNATISYYENGTSVPDAVTLWKIAKILQRPLMWFYES